MLTEVTTTLRLLALIAGDKALGYRGAAIVSALNGAAALFERGIEGSAQLDELNEKLKEMVAQGRDPSKEEFAALKSLSDAAHTAIQEPLEEKSGEE